MLLKDAHFRSQRILEGFLSGKDLQDEHKVKYRMAITRRVKLANRLVD